MTVRVVPAGDSALVVEFEDRIAPEINERAVALAESIQAAKIPGVRDVVPTFRSVAIYFDPLRVDFDALAACVERDGEQPRVRAFTSTTPVRIPVCYGGDLGPDLTDVATFAGVDEDEVIRIHSAATYRVFMLGFVAGFAYMGTVDGRIASPRLSTPRLRVPVGSVGIAGVQTGVYSAETPGGWRLIGRTPVKPFDPARAEPFLLKAGDAVQFHPIDRATFGRLERESAAGIA
jgi:inhibitor of KinA